MSACPCGSTKTYEQCCEPFIKGSALPETPEQLMRSRYSAYSLGLVDYIAATMKDKAAQGFHLEEARQWATSVRWLGLRVLNASQEGDKGFVEFKAITAQGSQKHYLHELSEFQRENERWYYVDGKRSSS